MGMAGGHNWWRLMTTVAGSAGGQTGGHGWWPQLLVEVATSTQLLGRLMETAGDHENWSWLAGGLAAHSH